MNYKELIELSQKAADEWRNDHAFYQAGTLIDSLCSAIENLLAEQDETNVSPVVHERWIASDIVTISQRNRAIHSQIFSCSHCGKSNGRIKKPYCPNCGAKMDLN